jgi:hypothetical protein
MARLLRRFAPVVAAAAILAGCASARPSIAELKYNPGRYHDRTVTVRGVVTSSWGLPLLPYRVYKIDDGTGEVTVVSQDRRVPTTGARVTVKGRVGEIATLGWRPIGLHIQQRDVRFERR